MRPRLKHAIAAVGLFVLATSAALAGDESGSTDKGKKTRIRFGGVAVSAG